MFIYLKPFFLFTMMNFFSFHTKPVSCKSSDLSACLCIMEAAYVISIVLLCSYSNLKMIIFIYTTTFFTKMIVLFGWISLHQV